MKTILKIFLIVSLVTFCECEKVEEKESLTPLQQLPPKTQTGANTAGCLVNGEAVYSKNRFNLFYQNQRDLGVSFNLETDNLIRSVGLTSQNETLELNKIYELTLFENNSKWGQYLEAVPFISEVFYRTDSDFTGELIITHHDYDNATISGEFWFDAVDSEGNKIEIREGRFDGQY